MERFFPNGLISLIKGGGAAKKAALELAGPKARAELLSEAGYGNHPEGLAGRLEMELKNALPIWDQPASLRGFGESFNGQEVMAGARAEAGALPYAPRGRAQEPASQVRPAYQDIQAQWPWLSGQAMARLARAHLLGRDDDLGRALEKGLERFCDYYPPLFGLGWARPPWLAARTLNWLMALRFAGAASLDPPVVLKALIHIKLHGMILAQELEPPGWRPGRAACAGGLLFMGLCLPFMPQAPAWREAGAKHLGPALAGWLDQGAALGGLLEEAAADCEWGGLGLWLGMKARLELPGLVKGLTGLAGAVRAVAPPWGCENGAWRGFAYQGQEGVLGLDAGRADAAAGAVNLAALLLNEPDLRGPRVFDERLYWLLGPNSGQRLRQLAGGKEPGCHALTGAGQVVMAVSAKGKKAGLAVALGGARALALNLCLGGRAVFAGPGPDPGGSLGNHLASRAGCSALLVDGAEPGPGDAVPEALEAGPERVFFAARYEGYQSLPDPAGLRRRVFLDQRTGIMQVVDQINANGEHQVQALFHLPPAAVVERGLSGELILRGGFGRVIMRPQAGVAVELVRGRSKPPLGWLARANGELSPATVVVLGARTSGNASLTTVLELAC